MSDPEEAAILRYEVWPTRMFATYTIWAIYRDGKPRQVGHGLPQHCTSEVERLNRLISASRSIETETTRA